MDLLLDVYVLSIALLMALIVIWGLTSRKSPKPRKPMADDDFETIIKHGLKTGSVKRINGRT